MVLLVVGIRTQLTYRIFQPCGEFEIQCNNSARFAHLGWLSDQKCRPESSVADYLAIRIDAHMEQERSKESRVVDRMYGSDAFSQWLGIERLEDGAGRSVLRLTVRSEMLNGFGIAHGAITYALADSALAFASNGHGVKSVSVETSISHTRPVIVGDVLTATARELNLTARFGIYEVKVEDGKGRAVVLFKGIVFRTGEPWDV